MNYTPGEFLQRIAQVQTGKLTVTEAARQLGISRKTYYQKEARALQAGLTALTPKAPGRPSKADKKELQRLRAEHHLLRQQLEALEQRR